ncbi:hypothetical protein PRIEUP_LOCUS16762, partial [Pristimantis euphronides]
MNLWIALIFRITLMQNFSVNYSFAEKEKWRILKMELDTLRKQFQESNYWKSAYQEDLRLYTARVDDFTDTCTQQIFDCYCDEFKVALEEISLSGETILAKKIKHTLDHMETYRPSENGTKDSCKKCEEYEEKSFQDFMNTFESLLQKKYSQQ